MRRFNSKGITLISLAITIAVLLILASIATYSGVDVIRQSKLDKFTAEMKVMQTQVNDLYQKYTDGTTVTVGSNTYTGDEILNKIGQDLPSNAYSVFTSGASGIIDKTGYRYYNQDTIKGLNIDGVEGEFYVNVKNRSVISAEGLEYDGITYYTLEQLPNGLYNVDYENKNTGKPTFDISTEKISDDSWRINISNIQYDGYINKWQVKYQLEGQDYWSTSEDLSFVVSNTGKYNIKLANGNVESEVVTSIIGISTDGSWSDEEGVNTPVIKDNMELVKWDEDNKEWVPDDTNSDYDYSNKEWANAKVTIDGVESYFVWIPRYKYKIEGQTIDVKFIPITETEENKADDGYIIHPAFTSNEDNGGWSEELPGIWVGKYESSLVNKADSSNIVTNDRTGDILLSDHIDKSIAVQPGMSSWRYCTIGNMYTNAKKYSPNLNSHMLKNSEWGAVAYLTESKYGRNGTEVTINNSSDYITGSAGNSIDAKEDVETTNDYTSEQGVLASSTGNVTGIYDLSGGAFEYVAAFYNNISYDLIRNGGSLVNETDKKYVTAYTGTSTSSAYKKGDATYETNEWHSDSADFVNSNNPFFKRGGDCSSGSYAGVFNFSRDYGNANNFSFRMCLAIK